MKISWTGFEVAEKLCNMNSDLDDKVTWKNSTKMTVQIICLFIGDMNTDYKSIKWFKSFEWNRTIKSVYFILRISLYE